jgi:hypothetical protein
MSDAPSRAMSDSVKRYPPRTPPKDLHAEDMLLSGKHREQEHITQFANN